MTAGNVAPLLVALALSAIMPRLDAQQRSFYQQTAARRMCRARVGP
jgi:hypothetical protein